MNAKQFILLLLVVIIIGGAGLAIYNKQDDSWNNSNSRLGTLIVQDVPINDVARLSITGPTGAVNLEKLSENWTVKERGGYPANFSQIRDFVRKLWELKVAQPQTVSEAQLSRFDLLAPDKGANAGTLIDFKDKDGASLRKLLIGKQHLRESPEGASPFGGGGYPDGRYLMVADDIKTVALVKDPLSDVNAEADHWLNKDFFKVDGARSVSVVAVDATNSWKLSRESRQGDWVLADTAAEETLDKSKLSSLNSVLSSPSFSDVAVGKEPAETGIDQGRTVTLETFDNFTYVIKLGSTNSSGDYHLQVAVSAALADARTPGEEEKPEDKERLDKEFADNLAKLKEKLQAEQKLAPWTYLVAKWGIDPILKNRFELMAEKKDETEGATTEVPNSPLVAPPTRVVSEPVRVPPVPEPIIPDPTQPPPVVPEKVEPPKPVELPPAPTPPEAPKAPEAPKPPEL